MLYQLSYFRKNTPYQSTPIDLSIVSRYPDRRQFLWEEMDSNHRRYKPADLQSAPFGHSGIFPYAASSEEDLYVVLPCGPPASGNPL